MSRTPRATMRKLLSIDAGLYWQILACAVLVLVVYLASVSGYILFHSVAEIFAIAISGAVFTLAWNSRRFSNQYYLLFAGIALLATSAINVLHTLSYDGLGVFPSRGANLPTQLWLARRYLESAAFLIAPLFLVRKFKPTLVLIAFAVVTTGLVVSIFTGVFPAAYVQGVGLTRFKVNSEYLISALFVAAAVWLYRERARLDAGTASKLIAALLISAGAEILFTLYVGVYDLPNRLGHFLTIIAYFLIYRAIVASGVIRPYKLLSEANASLSEREAALSETAARLQAEADARRQAQEVLEKQRGEMQALAHRLVEVQEDQSRALSREIHDTSGQALTALKIGLSLLKRKGNLDEATQARVDELREIADSVIEDLHRLSVNLRPSSLDRYGLDAALEQLTESVRKQTGIEVDYHAVGMEGRLPEDMETALYRIAQEATTNIARYSKATRASVVIDHTPDGVRVAVIDNGCGFDVADAFSRGRLGLIGMRERAQMLGGTFDITSQPGAGTSVKVEVPLEGGIS
jgi:signal transduction histidine kinase